MQSVNDFQDVIAIVKELREFTDGTVKTLREEFDSNEWRNRSRHTPARGAGSTSDSISDAIFQTTDRLTTRLENTLKKSQLLSLELAKLDDALQSLLPVYRLGAEIFIENTEIDEAIRNACEDLGARIEDTFA